MKQMLKDAMILFVITIIAGVLLGVVYQVTKEPIEEQNRKAQNAACKEVFADAASFEEWSAFDEASANATVATLFDYEKINGVREAKDASGNLLGYVITVTTSEGYGGDIQFMIGVQNDGTLNGMSILSISETAGLGMNADKVLKPQFSNKNVMQFEYTKTGAVADNQIDAISGATITTNAVTNGVNAGLYYFQNVLEGGSVNE